MSENREEKATLARKKKARDQGDVVRSRELVSGAAMLAGLATLGALTPQLLNGWRLCFAICLRSAGLLAHSALDAGLERRAAFSILWPVAAPLCAVPLASFVAALAVGAAQMGGLTLRPQAVQPKLSRVSPLEHVKSLVSARSAVRLLKSLIPAAVVAAMGWAVLRHTLGELPVLGLTRLPVVLSAALSLAMRAAMVSVVWAALDYAMEWRAWNARLRMTKQELREENKEQNGNPQVKARLRQVQRAMRKRRIKADMRRASVVITNPTHYAVALEFSFDTMAAPTVLAKGRDLLAQEIRDEARDAGVPLVENPPLARSLYRSVESGQSIPYELYAAIAGILAFLMRERQAEAARDAADRQQRQRSSPRAAFGNGLRGFEGGL